MVIGGPAMLGGLLVYLLYRKPARCAVCREALMKNQAIVHADDGAVAHLSCPARSSSL
jgi:hypothetical protein